MQLELGKTYRDRSGDRIGPMVATPTMHRDSATHPFMDPTTGYTYRANGEYLYGTGCVDDHDLVAVWVDQSTAQPETTDSPEFARRLSIMDIEDHGAVEPPAVIGHPHYASLAGILQSAHDQAAHGKGKRRHANDLPFLEQPIMEIARLAGVGIGGHMYQVIKKTNEAGGMVKRGEYAAAVSDLLGAINYAAAAILLIREIETESDPDFAEVE